MNLWDVVKFTTVRRLWLTTITRKGKPVREEWVPVSGSKVMVWSPNELHRYLTRKQE